MTKQNKAKQSQTKVNQQPKILLLDIETSPILANVWKIWDENIGLNQIKRDWRIIAWAAKFAHSNEVMYKDQRHAKDIDNDKALLRDIWKLIDEADVIVGHNSKNFDEKKLNVRFIENGFKPPKRPMHIDTLEIAKQTFGFTSNKLEHLSDKLCIKHKKLVHRGKYSGFDLWKGCLAGDQEAWKTMEKYNKTDVLALQEVYEKLLPWNNKINFDIFRDGEEWICSCGSKSFERRGFAITTSSKFQRYQCRDCGAWSRGKQNLFTVEKRKSLRVAGR